MEIKLFHYWRSSASWRVRWALEIKKVPHTKVHINLLDGEEKEKNYLALNPSGYVPCLIVDGNQLGESIPIIEWLEEKYPQPSLLPGDIFQRAFIRRLAETINSGIQPLHNLEVIKKISSNKEEQMAWSRAWIERGLQIYESLILQESKKKLFSVSDTPTIADLCLIPQCYSALRNEVNLNRFPRCKEIYEFALTTSECKNSHPDNFQPA